MRIITVSRQFGSGGREVGKRLADILGWDYYDREIIEVLADKHGLDPDYVRSVLSSHGWHQIQLTYRNSFSHHLFNPSFQTQLLINEREILQEIARAGNDCVIVGRDADVVLQDYRPLRMCICAELPARLSRCMAHEAKRPEEERLTEKQITRYIRQIDKNRIRTREILTGKAHGDGSTFDLTVNVTGRDLKKMSDALAEFSLHWFSDSISG